MGGFFWNFDIHYSLTVAWSVKIKLRLTLLMIGNKIAIPHLYLKTQYTDNANAMYNKFIKIEM